MDLRGWSKPFLTEFINIYRANPCLWRVKSKEYSNKNLRNAAYDRLVKYCQLAFPDANRDFVAKKIQSIRGSFRKELHKMRDCKKNNEVHNPSLWYYDLLLFTLDSENYTSNMNFPYVHCELQEGDCGGEDEECSITDPPLDEVGYCGLNSVFGRIATSLLKQSPCIQQLTLYDDDTSSSTNGGQADLFIGQDSLFDAIKNVNIVVIGDECYDLPEPERLKLVGRKLLKYTEAILQCSPNAIVVVSASPLNVIVPLTTHLLGPDFSKRVLGTTCYDTHRASRLLNGLVESVRPDHHFHLLPVIGGSTHHTRVPLFSQIYPRISISNEIQQKIHNRMQLFDTASYRELDAVERAYSTVRFVHSLIIGMTRGSPVPEIALSKSAEYAGTQFLSRPTLVGKGGIQKECPLPDLDSYEQKQLSEAAVKLAADVQEALKLSKHLQEENGRTQKSEHVSQTLPSLADNFYNISNKSRTSAQRELSKIGAHEKAKGFRGDTNPISDKFWNNDSRERKEYAEIVKRQTELSAYKPRPQSRGENRPESEKIGNNVRHYQKTVNPNNNIENSNVLAEPARCHSFDISQPNTHHSEQAENSRTAIDQLPEGAEYLREDAEYASNLLQEEISEHLEIVKPPIKSATQKFVESVQIKDSIETSSETETFENFEENETASKENGSTIDEVIHAVQKNNVAAMFPKDQTIEKPSCPRVERRPSSEEKTLGKQETKLRQTDEPKMETTRTTKLPTSLMNRKNKAAFEIQVQNQKVAIQKEFPINDAVTEVKKTSVQEEKNRKHHDSYNEIHPVKEEYAQIDPNEGVDYCLVAEPLNQRKERRHEKMQVNTRRQKAIQKMKQSMDNIQSKEKNVMPKAVQPGSRIQHAKKSTAGKGVVKSTSEKTIKLAKTSPHKTAADSSVTVPREQTRYSAMNAAAPKQPQPTATKKESASRENAVGDSKTTSSTNPYREKNVQHQFQKVSDKSLKSEVEQTENKTASSESKPMPNKGAYQLSGHSQQSKMVLKSFQPEQDKEAVAETAVPKKAEHSKPQLTQSTDPSGSKEPELPIEKDQTDMARADGKLSSVLLTTEKTKGYYIQQRRIPLETANFLSEDIRTEKEANAEKIRRQAVERQESQKTTQGSLDKNHRPRTVDVQGVTITAKPVAEEKGAKWDSKYLTLASDIFSKMFKDAIKQNTDYADVKSKVISKMRLHEEKPEMPTLRLDKFRSSLTTGDFRDTLLKENEALSKEYSFRQFGRMKSITSKDYTSASSLSRKRRGKYNEKKADKPVKITPKLSAKSSALGLDRRTVFLGASDASRSDKMNSTKRTTEQNKERKRERKSNRKDNANERAQVQTELKMEKSLANQSVVEEKKFNFDKFLENSFSMPLVEVKTAQAKGEIKETIDNSKKVRPLSKLQANCSKPEAEVVTIKPSKVTSDKIRSDVVNLLDFSVRPKSDLLNTDSWDRHPERCKTPMANTAVDQIVKVSNPEMAKTPPPSPTAKLGKVPISSKIVKQASFGRFGSSFGNLKKSETAQQPKHNKWERIFSVFKQIIINDIEGKNAELDSHRDDNFHDQCSRANDCADNQFVIDGRQSSTVKFRQFHKVGPQKRVQTVTAPRTFSAMLAKAGSASKTAKPIQKSSSQRKKKALDALKRKKLVPKNNPKKIVNYFSKRVETNESEYDRGGRANQSVSAYENRD